MDQSGNGKHHVLPLLLAEEADSQGILVAEAQLVPVGVSGVQNSKQVWDSPKLFSSSILDISTRHNQPIYYETLSNTVVINRYPTLLKIINHDQNQY